MDVATKFYGESHGIERPSCHSKGRRFPNASLVLLFSPVSSSPDPQKTIETTMMIPRQPGLHSNGTRRVKVKI